MSMDRPSNPFDDLAREAGGLEERLKAAGERFIDLPRPYPEAVVSLTHARKMLELLSEEHDFEEHRDRSEAKGHFCLCGCSVRFPDQGRRAVAIAGSVERLRLILQRAAESLPWRDLYVATLYMSHEKESDATLRDLITRFGQDDPPAPSHEV